MIAQKFGMVHYVCIVLSDGLIKKLEELEQNATIYKGKLFLIPVYIIEA